MAKSIYDNEVVTCIKNAQNAAKVNSTRAVPVDGQPVVIQCPFPSPIDWRDCWIYFLMIDRFNNPDSPPNSAWNQRYNFRQGGTFKGIKKQLRYIKELGAQAVWLTPVLKNSRPAAWEYNYHGYGAQDFLNVDERFGSDGTLATAEKEFIELVEEAHARGLHVILDIVLNHSARVFDYVFNGQAKDSFGDSNTMNAPFGSEPPVQWLNGYGCPRPDWTDDSLPSPDKLSPDDAVWPADLRRKDFFRRRGNKLTDNPGDSFVRGDFGVMRQLVVEYNAQQQGLEKIRAEYGSTPVLNILIHIHSYLISKYDIDGFRIDTVKYVDPQAVQIFGNAIREFALSIGKKNFFTFGEIYDNEATIAAFVGRNRGSEGFGIDAALDFPLFYKLPAVVKGFAGVETIRGVFEGRKNVEKELLSSHGEAGRFFVSFIDNHDQKERFFHPDTKPEQVTMALAMLFCLQGIPCLYYGTEQGLQGTVKDNDKPDLGTLESVREALWGKTPAAFDVTQFFYTQIKALSQLRLAEPSLRYGRLYFREVSGNGKDFGHSYGNGGILALSRILTDREVLVAANTSSSQTFSGSVLLDIDLNRKTGKMKVLYSNKGIVPDRNITVIQDARFFHADGSAGVGEAAAVEVVLAPGEVQILAPA